MSLVHEAMPELAAVPVVLPILFDYTATFIWALSGALVAARRGYVRMGILTIALVSATGGGLLRDSLILPGPPVALTDPVYLILVLIAVALVLVSGRLLDRSKVVEPAIHLFDALGAGSLAVVGANRAIAIGLPLSGVIVVGVVNAAGGALLRDVLMRRVPDLFRPGVPLAGAAMIGACMFSLMALETALPQTLAASITIGSVTILAAAMLQLGVKSRPLEAFREYWEGRD